MEKIWKEQLENVKLENRYRVLKEVSDTFLNLSSNDYCGFLGDENIRREFYEKYGNLDFSSGSSRLISGSTHYHLKLEEKLYDIYGKSALVFNSGYEANIAVIETLLPSYYILSDKSNHSSINSGLVNSGAKFRRYPHLDLNKLEKLLIDAKEKNIENIAVISESIYSMDGDTLDLKKLINLKKKYNFFLILDEAHSYGVYGYGLAYSHKILEYIDVLVIPLGKGGGSIGAYVLTSQLIKEYLVNFSRAFIYTTALPPLNVAFNLFILENMERLSERIRKLHKVKNYFHKKLKELGIETISKSHIVPIILGDNEKCDKVVSNMRDKNYYLHSIKYPTVPKSSSRIRISLNPNLTFHDIDKFLGDLKDELHNIS